MPDRSKLARPTLGVGGTNVELAHQHNRRAVFETLRVNTALSRAEIARATGLAKQTVTNIVEPMIIDGLLVEDPARIGERGQPAIPLRLCAEGAHAIGVHVEYHRLLGAAVDLLGQPIRREVRHLSQADLPKIVPIMQSMVKELRRKLPGKYLGLGVATPGPFGTKGMPSPGLGFIPGWDGKSVADILANAFGEQVFVENDATAVAAGERRLRTGAAQTDFVYLYLGIGVGAGLVMNEAIYRGIGGNAGEIGLLPQMGGDGRTYESSLSIVSLCKKLELAPYDPATHTKLEQLVSTNAPAYDSWMLEATQCVAQAVLMLEMLFDPGYIVIGGPMPQGILNRLVNETILLPSVGLRINRELPRLVVGAGDLWTAAIGAAAGPIASAFEPELRVLQKV